MSNAVFMRLKRELMEIEENPVDYIKVVPNESNIMEWFYCITGPPDTPYYGSNYFGKVTFPKDYPFAPPGIRMITPSGRFTPNFPICLSVSDYHPEFWNQVLCISTILFELLYTMTGNDVMAGGMCTTESEKKVYALGTNKFNESNANFKQYFPNFLSNESSSIKMALNVVLNGSEEERLLI
jgi:ubiquitin-conjugating enzyme E2 J2